MQSGLTDISPVDRCVVINSATELPEVNYNGTPLMFPEIDFDLHTLVIGEYKDTGGDCVKSRQLIVERDVATMFIVVGEEKGYERSLYPTMTLPAYFWGLYPKFGATTIHTNVIVK